MKLPTYREGSIRDGILDGIARRQGRGWKIPPALPGRANRWWISRERVEGTSTVTGKTYKVTGFQAGVFKRGRTHKKRPSGTGHFRTGTTQEPGARDGVDSPPAG